MKKTLFSISLFIVLFQAFGQEELHSKKKKAIADYKAGNEMLILNQVNEAQRLFESAIKRDKSFDEAILALTQVYIQKGELTNARNFISNSQKYLEEGFLNRAYYDLAERYLKQGEYEKASESFGLIQGDVLDFSKNDVEFLRENIAFAIREYERLNSIEKEELELELNQYAMQYFPSIDASGQLVFTARDKSWKGHEQIMVSNFASGKWSSPVLISDNINSELNEGTASISADGQTLVFTGCNRPKGFGSCDLYVSQKVSGVWTDPEILPKEVNSRFWDSQPSLSKNGDKLYFVSTRPGIGGQDIWLSKKINNEWTEAMNLGPSINTAKDDASPFIYPDDMTLFFASNGRPGMGQFDLFSSSLENEEWSTAINLGGAINDQNDQVGYSISLDGWAYYSNAEYDGRILLKRFRMPEELIPEIALFEYEIVITDSVTSEPLEAKINEEQNIVQFNPQSRGVYRALTQEQSIEILIESDGYSPKKVRVIDLKTLVKLEPVMALTDDVTVYFNTNEFRLSNTQKELIQTIVNLAVEHPELMVKIEGFADSKGGAEFNLSLAKHRLKSVQNFLISQGVKKNQIEGVANGEEYALGLLGDEVSSEEYRKVEIRLIKR